MPSMRWPPPPPGRVRWAWLLGLRLRRRRVRRLLKVLDRRRPKNGLLLDVGGGTGVGRDIEVATAPPGTYRRSVIFDAQQGMLAKVGRGSNAPHDAVCADAVRLPVRDACADVVLSLGVLCCLSPDAVPEAVDECWRVLRPGGLAVIGVPRRRGDADLPALLARGFRAVEHPRPGWLLVERPAERAPAAEAPV